MRRLLVAAGLACIAAGAWLWLRAPAPPAPPDPAAGAPRLLADVGGPIAQAVTSVATARRSALRNAALVSRIANALPARIGLLLLVNDRAVLRVASNPWPERVRFVELDAPLTIWPQDPFLVLEQPGGPSRILASRAFERAGDAAMAPAVAAALGWPLVESELDFEGGNVVADESRAFLGADTVAANAARLGDPPEAVVRRFEAELGRPVLVVGPSPQPIPHLDLVLTPLGEGRLLLGDPGLGADLAARALAEEGDAVRDFERAGRADFFGDPRIDHLETADGDRLEPPALEGATADAVAHSRALAAVYDGIAADLERHGYRVDRIPILLGPLAVGPEGEVQPGYPVLSYNNVLLEREGWRHAHVYLPRYGLAPLDRAARIAWEGAGFQVVPVEGLTTSAMYGGALRCTVKVLARSP